MTRQVPTAAKIRFLESQIELIVKQMSAIDADAVDDGYRGFQYQEEVLRAILDDYKQKAKTNDPTR